MAETTRRGEAPPAQPGRIAGTPAEAGAVRPDRHLCAGHAPWNGPEGDTNLRAVFRADALFGLLLGVVLVMAALRGVLAVVTELRQLVIKSLDGGFLLAKKLLDQVVPVGFERLLLGKEFFDVILGHGSIIRQARGRTYAGA